VLPYSAQDTCVVSSASMCIPGWQTDGTAHHFHCNIKQLMDKQLVTSYTAKCST